MQAEGRDFHCDTECQLLCLQGYSVLHGRKGVGDTCLLFYIRAWMDEHCLTFDTGRKWGERSDVRVLRCHCWGKQKNGDILHPPSWWEHVTCCTAGHIPCKHPPMSRLYRGYNDEFLPWKTSNFPQRAVAHIHSTLLILSGTALWASDSCIYFKAIA